MYELRQKSDLSKQKEFIELRKMPESVIEQVGLFHIGETKEMLLPKYLDYLEDFGVISNGIPIYNRRYVMPIYDTRGRVLNLVGYRPDAKERYMYATGNWYLRRGTLYGLENLNKAYLQGYAILTEGITDTIHLRGYGNIAFSTCGAYISPHTRDMLDRFRYGVICFPDRDKAGFKALTSWKFKSQVVIYPNINYKDIDEMLRDGKDNVQLVLDMIECAKSYLMGERLQGNNVEINL